MEPYTPRKSPSLMASLIAAALFLVIDLSACQRSGQHPTENTAAVNPAPTTAEITTPEPNTPVETAVEPPQPTAPLNLNLPSDIHAHSDPMGGDRFSEPDKLPDLFSDVKKQPGTSASARLLFDKENPEPVDSIEGVEFSFKKDF